MESWTEVLEKWNKTVEIRKNPELLIFMRFSMNGL